MLEGSVAVKGAGGHGNSLGCPSSYADIRPLTGRFLGWSSDSMAFREGSEKHTHYEEREHMEAMDGIPPQIPGYTFAQKLGSGSEANVYLYQQLSPSRQVAIKVSKGMLDPRAAARFRSEANFMGKVNPKNREIGRAHV